MKTILALAFLGTVAGCAAARAPVAASPAEPRRHGEGELVALLQKQATRLDPLVTTPFVHRFLGATRGLPRIATRSVTHDQKTIEVDEERYYDADVSSPLDYARPLDLVAARGTELGAGAKVLDYGFGSVGHLRLLASLGLDVTGIEVKPVLASYYAAPGDTGAIRAFDGGAPGQLRMLDGFFPADAKLKAQVGAGYDLVIAKNTLKKGYIHPDRPAPERFLIKLGVDDATFLGAFHDLLKPGGRMLVYNIFVPVPADQPFKPMSDGRSPFSKAAWEAAGFQVETFDQDDSPEIRTFLAITGEDDGGPPEFHALYTLVRRSGHDGK